MGQREPIFKECYTRENNPETYKLSLAHGKRLCLRDLGLSSFDKLPKILSGVSMLDLSGNDFENFIGFPKIEVNRGNRDLSLLQANSNFKLTSIEGLQDIDIASLELDNCLNLMDIEKLPKNVSSLFIRNCKKIESINSSNLFHLWADGSGLKTLSGITRPLNTLTLTHCDQLVDFDLKVRVEQLSCNISAQKNWTKLMNLHSLVHEHRIVRKVRLSMTMIDDHTDRRLEVSMNEVASMLNSISDPFEFQDKCISCDLEKFL